ncbi:LIM zinc-binding domain-containing Nebulette-like isoform X1 [Chelmon rostratus]|uniref:LIM zinc-binding domain-containing Nebulette-like isoform X1 n=1 Tax=Chelmon rostratus TaxID=109905 RepID=UPI001BEC93E0|nr:LIM zinc-binding domain-containing Nebulette-like isoform X1 [Chelmon rostratus]
MEPRSRRSIRQRSDRTLSRWVQERSRGHSHTFLLVRWLKGGQRGPLGLSIRTTLTISLYNKWTEAAGEQEEVWRMNPQCARCGKIVYPTEKVSCLDKNWHKGCFHCEVCKMTLNMKNYKGYDKKPYCNAHYPKTSFTIVADTPENLRLRQQSELQSQVKYKKDFEESKGRGFSIVSDTPEMQRLRRTQEQISIAKYHEDFERARGRGCTPGLDDPSMERYQRANQMMGEAGYSKGIHPQAMEMDRRPGGIIVAPVLPGAYHQGVQMQQQQQQQYHGYMHQTSMSSVRSVTSPPHSASMRVYRALYDYAAQDHDEVSFRDGDVIINAQPIDEGWMYGTVQRTGKSGMLPANYVECCN